MGRVLGIFAALLVLAVGFVLLTGAGEPAALLRAFRSLPLLSELAWVVIVFAPPVVLIAAVWLWYSLVQQRDTAQALELRLGGVRSRVKEMVREQADAEAAVRHLVRSDPEDALAAIQQRLGEAERVAQVQQSRNDAADLESRVDYIRAQQYTLKERLAPMLERRRSIEQLFTVLDSHQNDLDRTLQEIASSDDAVTIDIGLKRMMEFVKRSHGRCDDIERSLKIMAGLKEDYAELQNRLAPLAAAEDGVAARLSAAREARDRLAGNIDALLRTPEGTLAERVQKFIDDKKMLDGRLSEIEGEFSKLATLRKDIAGFFLGFNRALDVLAIERRGDGAADVDARVEELATFIASTQAHLGDIERRLMAFRQLRTKLGALQARLVPLEAADGGVVSVIDEIGDLRDKLALKIKHMEESDDGGLTERVKKLTETRRELEDRVATLTDQFVRLATIREDIAGLFEKLSSAVSASAG